jgi:FkbM family methyltransferase
MFILRRAKRYTKKALEQISNRQIVASSAHGHREYTDIIRSGCEISVVFDVGANVGQSALKFKNAFAKAKIFCFEPVTNTFNEMKKNVEGMDVICHRMALGNEESRRTIYLTDQSLTSSLIKPKEACETEEVVLSTADKFAVDNNIEHIDLMKIDAEGFDLEVLKGAKGLLSSGRVSFVLVEVGFHPNDNRHELFDDVRNFLMPMGYSVFGIYDQRLEWSGEQRLRFANACFVNHNIFV